MKLWSSKEENDKLLELIDKSVNEGNTINYGCERFCSMFPSYTVEQARARYYQLINSDKKMIEQTIVKPWDPKEEEELLSYFDEQIKNGKTKTKIFKEIAKKLNRSFNSVAGRYYILTGENKVKEKHKVKEINVEDFVKSLSNVDIKGLQKVLNSINELKSLGEDDATLKMHNLRLENDKLNEENSLLKETIDKLTKENKKISQINDTLKTKFDNIRESKEVLS